MKFCSVIFFGVGLAQELTESSAADQAVIGISLSDLHAASLVEYTSTSEDVAADELMTSSSTASEDVAMSLFGELSTEMAALSTELAELSTEIDDLSTTLGDDNSELDVSSTEFIALASDATIVVVEETPAAIPTTLPATVAATAPRLIFQI